MAQHRHKREPNARVLPRIALMAAPLAVVATVSAVTFGLVSHDPTPDQELLADKERTSQVEARVAERSPAAVSRSNGRTDGAKDKDKVKDTKRSQKKADEKAEQDAAISRELNATRAALRSADTKRWVTADLNLWTASVGGKNAGLLEAGKRVLVTGREADGRVEVVIGGKSRWVTPGYLVAKKPVVEALGASCTNGTSVPSNVNPNVIAVHRAVCAAFPSIRSYGTWRTDGEHGQGLAVDIMVSGELGWEVAEFLRGHAAKLGVEYLIYSQKIWSSDRAGNGWRGMADRGSATANHYDHVHVTVH